MKLAIPVKMNKENPPVAPLFGKAKWFAIVENGQSKILSNSQSGGQAVIEWLKEMGIEALLIQEIGVGPYKKAKNYGLQLYHTGFERILLEDVISKFEAGELEILDDTNIGNIIKHGERRDSRKGMGHRFN